MPVPAQEVDPRGPRFGASVTTVLLALVLVTGSGWLLAAVAMTFAIGAVRGIAATPYALVFRRLIRPRLSPPSELEDARPPQFAQAVGLVFALIGVVGALTGLTPVFLVATAFALGAAFLNAAFGYCLGCEMYLLRRRFSPTTSHQSIEEIPA